MEAPKRPAAVLVFGIIHLSIAGLGALGMLGGWGVQEVSNQPNPLRDHWGASVFWTFTLVTGALQLLLFSLLG